MSGGKVYGPSFFSPPNPDPLRVLSPNAPTQAGYYWAKPQRQSEWTIVEVSCSDDMSFDVEEIGADWINLLIDYDDFGPEIVIPDNMK